MKHNNFDDFLLDPSHDDLDSLHLEAERQLYKKGGLKKLVKKVKNKLTSKKKKKSGVSTTDAQAAQIEKVASSNPKGSKSTVATKAPKPPTRKIEVKKTTPKVNAPAPKKIQTKEKSFGETFKENRKMLGAGKTFTYKGKKYSTNTKDDLAKKKKPVAKKKTTSALSPNATQRKKLTSRSMFDKIPTGNKMESGGMKKDSMKSALKKRRKKGGYKY